MRQAEMPFPTVLQSPRWVEPEQVKQWQSWREAVLWCWENRVRHGNEHGDQVMFRHFARKMFDISCHAPHITRWVKRETKGPMDLPVDLKPAFEVFTGWRGLTQYQARIVNVAIVEELQARRYG
jgi:hypothetical protein